MMGAMIFVGTAAFNTWLRANDNSRRLDVLEKTVEQMAVQNVKTAETMQSIQIQITAQGGDIKNIDTKLDGLRPILNMLTLTARAGGGK